MGPVIIKNLSLSDLGSNSYGLGLNYGQPHPRSNRSVCAEPECMNWHPVLLWWLLNSLYLICFDVTVLNWVALDI